MTEQTNLDQHPRLPYSIGTGIPKQGEAEIEGYLQSLRVQGFCVIERVIPEDEVAAARDNVLRGRELLLKDREPERRKRIELEHQRNPDAEIDDSPQRLDNWRADPAPPPRNASTAVLRWGSRPKSAISRGARSLPSIWRRRACSRWPGRSWTRTSVLCRPKSTSRRGRQRSRSPKNNDGDAAGIRTGRTI